ncbi:hypothetical protein [Homoserinimonas aerilata]|uniref:hypothetical protein n=1 Tax=Homoserinimonas aerilata TaxID=1162970 RepID=UPI00114F73B9|nr:hypothetical protein [Homoserinimonas aerilata]
MSNSEPEPANRLQRVLAFMVAALVILALLCFAGAMVGYFMGALENGVSGFWITLVMIPWFALPAALLLTVALLIVTGIRRSRENRR